MDGLEDIARKNGTGITELRKISGNRRDESRPIGWRKKKKGTFIN